MGTYYYALCLRRKNVFSIITGRSQSKLSWLAGKCAFLDNAAGISTDFPSYPICPMVRIQAQCQENSQTEKKGILNNSSDTTSSKTGSSQKDCIIPDNNGSTHEAGHNL